MLLSEPSLYLYTQHTSRAWKVYEDWPSKGESTRCKTGSWRFLRPWRRNGQKQQRWQPSTEGSYMRWCFGIKLNSGRSSFTQVEKLLRRRICWNWVADRAPTDSSPSKLLLLCLFCTWNKYIYKYKNTHIHKM